MIKYWDRLPVGESRREAAQWWVELHSDYPFTRAQEEACLDWISRAENQRAYKEVNHTYELLRRLQRPADATADELMRDAISR